MISVEEALRHVMEQVTPLPPAACRLEDALGCVLANSVASDIDSPPYDKSLVDGYAVRSEDMEHRPAVLDVLEEVTAGQVPTQPLVAGACTRIMTGAPLPAQADAVVMVEDSELTGEASVQLNPTKVGPGQNILRQGVSMKAGETVLTAGKVLRCIDLGLLAEIGVSQVEVYTSPRVAILSTGDELVEYSARPGPGQIRNSNSVLLKSLVRRCGGVSVDLGIVRDHRDKLQEAIRIALAEDVVVLSGGVSAGVLDLVPAVLDELAVRCVFHKVRLKPGKPLWFGVLETPPKKRLVFGLPGNPVSGLVCFALFVRPALRALSGHAETTLAQQDGKLTRDFTHRGPRPTYHPAIVTHREDVCLVETLNWKGSADMRTLADANALAYFPAGDHRYSAGDQIKTVELL